MIVNPNRFQVILLEKRKSNNTDVKSVIDSGEIQSVSSPDILGITTDDKMNFNLHIDKICLTSSNQPNTLVRLKPFLGFLGNQKV